MAPTARLFSSAFKSTACDAQRPIGCFSGGALLFCSLAVLWHCLSDNLRRVCVGYCSAFQCVDVHGRGLFGLCLGDGPRGFVTECWYLLQPLERPEMIALEHPSVSWDFQWVLLLRWRPLSKTGIFKSRWLWLCRQDDPSCWHAVRLAIYGHRPSS